MDHLSGLCALCVRQSFSRRLLSISCLKRSAPPTYRAFSLSPLRYALCTMLFAPSLLWPFCFSAMRYALCSMRPSPAAPFPCRALSPVPCADP